MRAEEVGNGRFVLADVVGRGGTGTVWRAWDRKHERFCAVRPVRRGRGGGARFELTDGLRVRDPHLLTPYAAVEDGGRVLLAAPLVAGGSLRDLLAANGPLSPATVADLLDQMLAGLAALHAEGIAHRGVRAGAVLLDATYGGAPRLRLAGFGSAAREPDGFDEDLLAAGTVAAALLDGPAPGRLAAVLDALRAQDPDGRPTAPGARDALRVARPAAEPRTADESRVLIADRLPPLPSGWTPDGPPARPRAAPAVPITEPSTPQDVSVVAGPVRRWGRYRPEHARLKGVRGPIAGAAAAAVVLVGAGIAAAVTGGDPPRPGAPAQPRPTEQTGPAAAGERCGWQREGDVVTVGGRPLRCALTGGGYRWTPG